MIFFLFVKTDRNFIQNYKLNSHQYQGMGCTQVGQQPRRKTELKKVESVVGKLTVSILSLKFQQHVNFSPKTSYIKMRMSNQEFTTINLKDLSNKNSLKSKFQFVINSCYKIHGRMLTLQIWDNHSQKNTDNIGLSIIDLEPYLKQLVTQHQVICYINYNRKPAGFVKLNIKFQECQYQYVSFKINSVYMRQSLQGQRLCFTRITVGEQIQQTKAKIISEDHVPCWKRQIKTFRVPNFVDTCIIDVLECSQDQYNLLGQLKINLKDILCQKTIHNEYLSLDQTITGTINFQILQFIENFSQSVSSSDGRSTQNNSQKSVQDQKKVTMTNISTSVGDSIKVIEDMQLSKNKRKTLPPLTIQQQKNNHCKKQSKTIKMTQTSFAFSVQKSNNKVNNLDLIKAQDNLPIIYQ